MADGAYICAAVAGVNADNLALQYASGIGGHIVALFLVGGRGSRSRGSGRFLFIGLLGADNRNIHYQTVGLFHLCVRTEGKDADVINFLGLGEGYIQIGVTILFGQGDQIHGPWVHVILGGYLAKGSIS